MFGQRVFRIFPPVEAQDPSRGVSLFRLELAGGFSLGFMHKLPPNAARAKSVFTLLFVLLGSNWQLALVLGDSLGFAVITKRNFGRDITCRQTLSNV